MFAAIVILGLASASARAGDDAPPGADASSGLGFTFSMKEEQRIAELAKGAKQVDDAFVVKTERFVVSVPSSPRLAAQMAVFLDLFQDAFFARLEVKPQVEVAPTVVVYATNGEFLKKCDNGERSSFGWLWKDKGWPEFHVYTALQSPAIKDLADFDIRPIQRGMARALLRRIAGHGDIPVWLDEGMASWFEGLDIRADFMTSRTARLRRSPYLRYLRGMLEESATPLEISSIFALDVKTWNTDRFLLATQRREAMAESFVDLLLATDQAKAERKQVIDALRLGRPFKDLQEKDLKALQKKWLDHAREIAEHVRIG